MPSSPSTTHHRGRTTVSTSPAIASFEGTDTPSSLRRCGAKPGKPRTPSLLCSFGHINNENRAAFSLFRHRPYSRQGLPSRTVAVSTTFAVPPHLSLHLLTPQELGTQHPLFSPLACLPLFLVPYSGGTRGTLAASVVKTASLGPVSAPAATVGVTGQQGVRRVSPLFRFL